ncbi:MAG: bacterial Ig-like domain-containing protein [Clostridia bacterium]|nr:bacterial Ig-like domain-containing protein [Clostridia bacterium]
MRKYLSLLTLIICFSFVFVGCTWGGDTGKVIIDTTNVKTELNYNEDLDLSGLVVKAKKGNSEITLTTGTSESSSRIYTINYGGFDKTVSGTYTITISYKDYQSATFTVTVAKEVASIEVVGLTRTDYILNEQLDLTGGTLQLNYVDNTTGSISLTHSDVTIGNYSFATAGTKLIVVSYLGKICNFEVIVHNVALESIEVQAPTKVEYKLGETLSLDGGKILLNYSNLPLDIPSAIVPSEISFTSENVTLSQFDSTTSGQKTITVTYLGLQDSFVVDVVAPIIVSVDIVAPTKTAYRLNDELNLDGGYLSLSYNYAVNETLTPATVLLTNPNVQVTGFSSETVGECEVTVTYSGFTKTFTVEIVAPVLTGITLHEINKVGYYIGESLDLTGAYLATVYDYGDGEEISLEGDYTSRGVVITGFDSTTSGEKTVTVTYQGKSATFVVDIWNIDENEFVLGFKVNNNAIDINNVDYIEFKDDVDVVSISVTVDKDYILAFDGENASGNSHSGKLVYSCCNKEIGQSCTVSNDGTHAGNTMWNCCTAQADELDCINSSVATFTKEIDWSHHLQNGTEVKVFVYDRHQYMLNGAEASLVYSKNLALYNYSYVDSLVVNGVEFVRTSNDTYSAKNGELVTPLASNTFDVELQNDYIYYIRQDSGSSSIGRVFARESKFILDVYYYEEFEDDYIEELIQSFYIDIECDETLFEEVLSEMTVSGQSLYSGVINLPSGTDTIFIDLGEYNETYTMQMYVDGQIRNYVGGTDYGHYYVNEGLNVFTLKLTSSTASLLFKIVAIVGDVDAFAYDFISSLRVADVEAEYDFLENRYIVHKPQSTSIDVTDFSIVFEDGFDGYSFDIEFNAFSTTRATLTIYDKNQNEVHSCKIEIVNFDVAVTSTEFLALYMQTTNDSNTMAINFLDFDSNRTASIVNCLEGTPIQFTFIYDYTRYSVSSNCIGLADKNGKNFTAFLVNSGTATNYITVTVKAQSGKTETYTINVLFKTQPYITINVGSASYTLYGSDIMNGSGDFELVTTSTDKYYQVTVPRGTVSISSTKNTVISFTANNEIGFYATTSTLGGLVSTSGNINIGLDLNNSFTLYVGYCADITDSAEIENYYENAIKLVLVFEI